jgi:hypothetical protein
LAHITPSLADFASITQLPPSLLLVTLPAALLHAGRAVSRLDRDTIADIQRDGIVSNRLRIDPRRLLAAGNSR